MEESNIPIHLHEDLYIGFTVQDPEFTNDSSSQNNDERKASTDGVLSAHANANDETHSPNTSITSLFSRDRSDSGNSKYKCDNLQLIEKETYKYLGEMKNEQRDGFGVCNYNNGDIFKGLWRSDQREGFGVLITTDGCIFQGEMIDDNFEGFCEKINPNTKQNIIGHCHHNEFTDIVIVKNENKTFEGEVLPNETNSTNNIDNHISIGRLISTASKGKKGSKIFMGEIKNYNEECGYGICLFKANNSDNIMYQGKAFNKNFEDFLAMYNSDGGACFCYLENSKKNGFSLSFTKDGKVSFGEYRNNFKEGPFFSFSNCHNLPKSSVRMEIYQDDFKSKVVDKMETSKKYLSTYYPEYSNILHFNYSEVITKLNDVINDELAYLTHIKEVIESNDEGTE